ncbi:MAG: hypothetical protein WDA47_03255 [Bacilli bacterium]|jgi:uncharacterized membrane protein YgaE (UPF0421/DUF939 family)|nr:hypothetical protein [Candidatus Saccharicenans sp.]
MTNFNPELQGLILAWIGGIPAIIGLTEWLKGLYKNADDRLKKILNYITSFVVSFGVCAAFLALTGQFRISLTILECIPIWLASSGIYDATHVPKAGT